MPSSSVLSSSDVPSLTLAAASAPTLANPQDLVPLIQHFPRQLFELLALTLKATLDTRLRPLLAASVGNGDADEQAEVDEWEGCAQRIVGGASVRSLLPPRRCRCCLGSKR